MTSATTSNWIFRKATVASPATFTDLEECFNISGLGETNALIDVTNFDSAGSMEFIGGLADGQEITVECNYVQGATEQEAMVAAVKAKANLNFQIGYTGVSPDDDYDFVGTPLEWTITPSVDDKNVIAFRIKVSGAITTP